MKIALFGGCVPRGVCSFYSSTGEVEFIKNKYSLAVCLQDKFGTTVLDYSMRRSGLHHSGNIPFPNETMANPSNSVENKIKTHNLDGVTHMIVWAPSNDYGAGVKLEDYLKALDSIIEFVTNKGIKLVFITSPCRYQYKKEYIPSGCYTKTNSSGLSLNDYADAVIQKCLSSNIPCIDFRKQTVVTDDNNRETMPDALHPTPEISKEWNDFIYNNIINFIHK